MSTELPSYYSPKRKRDTTESDYHSPSESPTSTVSAVSFQEPRLREDTELGRQSPRAVVAGRFGALAIRGERLLGKASPESSDQQKARREKQSAEKPYATEYSYEPKDRPEALPPDGNEFDHLQDYQRLPETISRAADDFPITPTASPSRRKPTSSPRKAGEPVLPFISRKQRISPPPTETISEYPFTWHDSEITGHDPSDPTDDGYGINGVGFKPTAAMAWARSQKRQKQVSEWKTREAREARERRRERRNDGIGLETSRGIHKGAIQKRVKFDV